MRAVRRLLVVSVALIAVASALVLGSSASPRAARATGQPVELFSVDAFTAGSAWASGDYFKDPSDYGDYFSATERLRSGHWARVSAPSPSSYKAALFSVDALSSTNAWAAGQYNAHNGNDYTLIEHWAGGRWHIVKSPNPGQFGNGFASISAASASYIWAVGYYGPPHTLIARWRGGGWKVVKSQDPSTGTGSADVLSGVSAVGPGSAWAVGYQTPTSGAVNDTLIEHWNGSSWQVQQGVDPSNTDNELLAVKAISPSDVWAVGYYTDGTGDHPLLEHYDGVSWTRSAGAAISGQATLSAVGASATGNVWAVGSTGGRTTKTFTEHFDGANWTQFPAPSPSKNENALLGVSVRASGDAWAVGYYSASSGHKSLLLHWNGTAWSVK